MALENAYHGLYVTVLVVLSVMTLLCLVRAIRGPASPTAWWPST
jgi:multisubunit Na+/H+ antiporter MnhF subunit